MLHLFRRNKLLFSAFGAFEISVYAAIVFAVLFPAPAHILIAVLGAGCLLTLFAIIRKVVFQ